MADFARQNPGLGATFPSSSLAKHEPSRLDEVVQLTHPFLGPLVRHRDAEGIFLLGVGAGTLFSVPVPPDEVWYVPCATVQNPDAAQHLEVAVAHQALGLGIPVRNSRSDNGGAAWPAVVLWPALDRPLLIPPGWQLRFFREVGGVGGFNATFLIVRFKLAEVPPSI